MRCKCKKYQYGATCVPPKNENGTKLSITELIKDIEKYFPNSILELDDIKLLIKDGRICFQKVFHDENCPYYSKKYNDQSKKNDPSFYGYDPDKKRQK